MPSLLPGYNYDIFLSYRHKDNKYDGWVTEFVQNLKKELDATFKDEISIYFDFNQDDGLLETHNVDKSLEGKLKCLIFIPILSQTYCDPRSFAWQHELQAFNELAKNDAFGRDIKLRNGNVASRVLPVKVRELDADDKKLIEDELGSVLRSVDFIYKEQGVNRPLKPEDPEEKNLNRTKYRNQINKTANAIKEIISAIQWKQSGETGPPPAQVMEEPPVKQENRTAPYRKEKRQRTPLEIILRWVVLGGLIFYFVFWVHRNDDEKSSKAEGDISDKSIAVLPFEDLSPAHDQAYFSDGIAEEILNSLAHVPNLKVAGRTSSFQFKGQKADLKEVGRKLNVSTVLEGSVRKAGNRVRITAQLIGVKDGYHIWSETYDRDMTDIFAIQDEVATKIAGVLQTEMAVSSVRGDQTANVKAYEYYLEGKYINIHQFVTSGNKKEFLHAEELFKEALRLDSNYALAHAGLADLYNSYTNRIHPDSMYLRLQQKEIDIAYRLNPNLDYVHNVLGNVDLTFGKYDEAYKDYVKSVELNPREAINLNALAAFFMRVGLLDQSEAVLNRAIKLEPLETNNFFLRGSIYLQLGRYDDAIRDLKTTEREQPSNIGVIVELGFLYLIKNDLTECKKYVDKENAIDPNLKKFTGLDASYYARLGEKQKALTVGGADFRTFLILGMDKEAIDGILKFFALRPPVNFYLSMTASKQLRKLDYDDRVKKLIQGQKEGYEVNKRKYTLPALAD